MEKSKKIRFHEIEREVSRCKTPEIFDTFWEIVNDNFDEETAQNMGFDEHNLLQIQQRSDFYAADLLGYDGVDFESQAEWFEYLQKNGSGCWCDMMKNKNSLMDFSCIDVQSQVRCDLRR